MGVERTSSGGTIKWGRALLFIGLLFQAGCGKKGPPTPPEEAVYGQAARDSEVHRIIQYKTEEHDAGFSI
ncbi:MAG: hypothetical protein ACE5F7_02925 [Nitrospiria bacterium]